MSSEPEQVIRLDRRHRRREETIEEILDVAVAAMAEFGAAGLSLGEVARRMGIRTPSLYVYFDSKNALYDAIFERGWRDLARSLAELPDAPTSARKAPAYVLRLGEGFVRWAIAHQPYSQLLFWRPVPGYEPSPRAYEAAVDVLADGRNAMVKLRDCGGLRPDVDVDEALSVWTVLVAGVVSQQLANAPDESFEEGRFAALLPQLVSMFLNQFGPQPGAQPKERKSNADKRR
jgi:AcrR family transcriptional regulator